MSARFPLTFRALDPHRENLPVAAIAVSGSNIFVMPTTQALSSQEIVDLTRKHTIFEWSIQSKVDPIPVAGAEGCWFWTPDGKRYLDFNSQLKEHCNLFPKKYPALLYHH